MSAFHVDSAWSWLVLLMGICAHGIGAGVMLSYGVYYVEYVNNLGATNKQASALGSLAYASMLIPGR